MVTRTDSLGASEAELPLRSPLALSCITINGTLFDETR